MEVDASPLDASPPSDGQGQENASGSPHGVGDRRKAPHRASPAPRGPHHHAGGASASMLMLAEAVVANVLGDEGAFTKGSQQQQQFQAFGQQGQMWTPATPVRATHAMAPAGMETPGGVPHHPGPGLFPLGGVPTIAADDMELGPRLGDGTYAVVHAGWWRGAAVAVKILRRSTTGDGQAQQQQDFQAVDGHVAGGRAPMGWPEGDNAVVYNPAERDGAAGGGCLHCPPGA